MAAWTVVPCLLKLRDEFNELSPDRDKGSDGTIGDSAHTSSSDHTPDEDSDVLRDHDADDKNEVHALDIDSSGPWPGTGTQKQRFHAINMDLIAREKAKWLDPNDRCRLNYVIWDGHIYDKDNDFAPAVYNGSDPHTGHGHYSSRYETSCENDIRPFGVLGDDVSKQDVIDAFKEDGIFPGPTNAASVVDGTNPTWTLAGFLKDTGTVTRDVKAQTNLIPAMSAAITAIGATLQAVAKAQNTDAASLSALQSALAALSVQVDTVDEAVADRLFTGSNADIAEMLVNGLGEVRAQEVARAVLG